MIGRPSGNWGNTSAKRWENYPELLIGAERELSISLEWRPALSPSQVWNQFHQKWQSSIFGHKGKSLQPDVISSKMRKTVLVGGKLSSWSPHYEGSERNDFVKVVKSGLGPFWWRKLKQTWRMSDELKMTLWRTPLPQSEPTPESWQLLYKQADFWTQQLVAVSEAVGTRRSRRRPGRDQQIGIVLCAANLYYVYYQSAAGTNYC